MNTSNPSVHDQFADDLALYALGVLEKGGCAALESHLAACAECQAELGRLRNDAALLALSVVGPAPPERARKRLLSTIGQPSLSLPRLDLRAVVMRRPWWAMAPVFASLVLAIFTVLLFEETRQLKEALAQQEEELRNIRAEAERSHEVLNIITSHDAVHATMTAFTAKPQASATAMYLPQTGKLLLLASNLEPCPPQKIYQLWMVPYEGAPIAAGTFMADEHGNAVVKILPAPKDVQTKSFAVTLEPDGGSRKPTMPILLSSPMQGE
jgi:anti-sigma-K factor RskA